MMINDLTCVRFFSPELLLKQCKEITNIDIQIEMINKQVTKTFTDACLAV